MASFYISPIGTFRYPWFNKPDTKFNADGLFHTELHLSGKQAEELAAKIEAAAHAALAEHTQEMKPGEAKKWSLYLPFERIEDDEGNPTGDIKFDFKQNAKIPLKDGSVKDVRIELRDSKDNIITVPVWDGSEGRIMFTMRPITMAQAKEAGVRLDFAKVQITKLANGSGGGGRGFGEVEDGFVADTEGRGFGNAQSNEPEGEAEDY
ncbi:hypothetical protein [Brucella intermedia]|uniref:hypothetical protein n=1 Tax=Brucella intermedia TaxID=94625 RepID=UPI00224A5043|nr:hypothetical protein [Brucella intermedia]